MRLKRRRLAKAAGMLAPSSCKRREGSGRGPRAKMLPTRKKSKAQRLRALSVPAGVTRGALPILRRRALQLSTVGLIGPLPRNRIACFWSQEVFVLIARCISANLNRTHARNVVFSGHQAKSRTRTTDCLTPSEPRRSRSMEAYRNSWSTVSLKATIFVAMQLSACWQTARKCSIAWQEYGQTTSRSSYFDDGLHLVAVLSVISHVVDNERLTERMQLCPKWPLVSSRLTFDISRR